MRPLVKRGPNGHRYAVPPTAQAPAANPPRQSTNGHASALEPTPPHRLGHGRGRSKLTDDDVRAIRADYATGRWTHRDLAYIYDVAPAAIGSVIRGKSYTHVENDTL
jgi:hypothetical protein